MCPPPEERSGNSYSSARRAGCLQRGGTTRGCLFHTRRLLMLHRNTRRRSDPSLPRPNLETLEGRVLFAAGDLDPNFGMGGIARADFGVSGISGIDVAASGSHVYAAGYFAPDTAGNARI